MNYENKCFQNRFIDIGRHLSRKVCHLLDANVDMLSFGSYEQSRHKKKPFKSMDLKIWSSKVCQFVQPSILLAITITTLNKPQLVQTRYSSLGCNALWINWIHYCDVIMGTMASQITSLTIVFSSVPSGADLRKHHSSASLAFVRGIHRWIPRTNGQWRGKCFHLMTSSWNAFIENSILYQIKG